jgi:hypothetical protein
MQPLTTVFSVLPKPVQTASLNFCMAKADRVRQNLPRETVAGPFFNGANPDQLVVFFTLDITPKVTGQRIALEEAGVNTVKNDKITREQFFYDGER